MAKKIIGGLLIILILWILYSYFNEGVVSNIFQKDPKAVADYIRSFGPISIVLFILVVIAEVLLAPIPPLILYVVAGILYGGFYGGVIVLAGNLIGAYLAFIIARYFLREKIKQKTSEKFKEKFNKYLEKYGFISIILLRLNPVTTSDLVSYLAGLTKMSSFKFILATTIGLIPLIFSQTYLGSLF